MELFVELLALAISLSAVVIMSSIFWGMIRTRGVPFISSPKKHFDRVLEEANLKPGQKVYDLGCGKAHFLVRASKKFGLRGEGYEMSLAPYWWGRFNVFVNKADVKLHCQNFFKADLHDADLIYCYLFPEVMAKLSPKFKAELKPGAKVISYDFRIPDLTPAKEIITNEKKPAYGRILVYEF